MPAEDYSMRDRRRAIGTTGIVLLGVVLAAGCSNSEGGTPVTTESASGDSPTPSAPSSGEQADGAPSVTDPIDTAKLDQDPCSALSGNQVERFSLNSGVREKVGTDPTCEYNYGDDSGSQISITPMQSFSDGLSTVYQQESQLDYFEPTEVSGYPGVYGGKLDSRDNGYCGLYVGLNDQRTVWFDIHLAQSTSDYPKGCEVGEVAAEAMIENLKGGA